MILVFEDVFASAYTFYLELAQRLLGGLAALVVLERAGVTRLHGRTKRATSRLNSLRF